MLLADLVGERRNRRHRPGRGLETLRYRFEIVSDYGAFRDLQRHRMLSQWQTLSRTSERACPRRSTPPARATPTVAPWTLRDEYDRLAEADLRPAAPYALCLGYRIRYVLELNAREAMHLLSSCAPVARAIPPTARWRTRCTRRSPPSTPRSPRR